MSYRSIYSTDAAAVLSQLIRTAQRACWFGAISFEDRCVASLRWLEQYGLRLGFAIAVNYPTDVKPHFEDKRRRQANRDLLHLTGKSVFADASL